MISVIRPFEELVTKPFEVRHTSNELSELAKRLKSLKGETRVVLEHTGRYYEPVAQILHDAGVSVSANNLRLGRISDAVYMDHYRYKALQTLTMARFSAVQNQTREKQNFINYYS